MPEIREPKKVNSIEKKKRIIEAGLKLFGEVGFYKTNTAEIAKEAGVSTGIVYNYFMDKKDILLYAVQIYFEKIQSSFTKAFEEVANQPESKAYKKGDVFKAIVPLAIPSHKENTSLHKQMLALSLVDDDVKKAFKENKQKMVENIISFVSKFELNIENSKEKAILTYQFIESLISELIYNPCDDIDENALIENTVKALSSLFID